MQSHNMSEKPVRNESTRLVTTKLRQKWDKYVYTLIFVYTHIAFGMTMTMYAPVMVDMKYILHTSIRYVSLYTTFLSAGYMTGTVFGYLYEYLNRQLTAIIFLAFMSIGSALTPLSPDLSALYTCAFLVGMGASVWNSMCNVWMIELWGHRSAPLLQLLHCGFGVGNIISPLILKSHLIGEIHSNSSTGSQSIGNYTNETEVWVESSVDRRAELIIPFQINAFIQLLSPVALFAMFVWKRYKPPQLIINSNSMSVTDNTPAPKLFDRDGFPRKRAILLFCVWLSTYCVAEATILSFGATYFQYCPLKLTAQESAQLLSAVAIAFTIGRGLSVLTALRYSPKQMIGYHFVVLIIAAITLYVGQYNLSVLWVSTILTGLGLSAMCPAMFAYLEQYLSITNPIGAIAIFSSEVINLLNPYILGVFVERYSWVVLMFESIYVGICLLLFVSFIALVDRYSRYFNSQIDKQFSVIDKRLNGNTCDGGPAIGDQVSHIISNGVVGDCK